MAYLCTAYAVSERRACRTVRCAKVTQHYQSHRDPRTALRQRIREMAQTRVRYGYRKIRVLFDRERWAVGKKLVYRLYREEGLMLCHRIPRRRKAVVPQAHRPTLTSPNEAWTLDFVADQLTDDRRFRALAVADVFTRESLAIEVGQRLRGEDVVALLNSAASWWTSGPITTRSPSPSRDPASSRTMLMWNRLMRPCGGSASMRTGSSHCGTFTNGIESWRREYTESRPHLALQDRTPEEFARAVAENHLCEPLITVGNSPLGARPSNRLSRD